ncbi:Long-chain-fatty-acid--CoA ligase 1, partial [Goodea atripinnis]
TISTVICDVADKARMILDCISGQGKTVKTIVLMEAFDRDLVFSQANTPLKRWLLDFAFRRKEAELKNGVMRKDSMWDKLIFKKVQVSLGGQVRLMITGAAPVSPTILTFLRAALGCQVRDIALHPEMFSVQNGLLTPTLKAKRNELRSHFREQIDELYAKIKM